MTPEDKHRAEVHRLKALHHLKAADILEGKEPAKTPAAKQPHQNRQSTHTDAR